MVATRALPRVWRLPLGSDPAQVEFSYRLVMTTDRHQVFANEAADLLDDLIPGYAAADKERRVDLRVAHVKAVHSWEAGKRVAGADYEGIVLTPDQRAALLAPAGRPPQLQVWDGPIPLTLLWSVYDPDTRPVAADGCQILWLRPALEGQYLRSLARVGHIQLAAS